MKLHCDHYFYVCCTPFTDMAVCQLRLIFLSLSFTWCHLSDLGLNLTQPFILVLCSQTTKSPWWLVGCSNPSSDLTLYLDDEVCLFSFVPLAYMLFHLCEITQVVKNTTDTYALQIQSFNLSIFISLCQRCFSKSGWAGSCHHKHLIIVGNIFL